jgi:hypothetical protein
MVLDPLLFAPIAQEKNDTGTASETEYARFLKLTAPMWTAPLWTVKAGDVQARIDYVGYKGDAPYARASLALNLNSPPDVKSTVLPGFNTTSNQAKCVTLAKQNDGTVRFTLRAATGTLPCWSSLRASIKLTFTKPVSAVVFVERLEVSAGSLVFVLEDGTKLPANANERAVPGSDNTVFLFDENARLQDIEYGVSGACPKGGAYALFRIYPFEAKDVGALAVPAVEPMTVTDYLAQAPSLTLLGLYSEDDDVWLDKKVYAADVLRALKSGGTYAITRYFFLNNATATLSQLLFMEDEVIFSVHAHRKGSFTNPHKGAFVRFVLPRPAYMSVWSVPVSGLNYWHQMMPVADLSIIENPLGCFCRTPSSPAVRTAFTNVGTLMYASHDVASTVFENLNLNNLSQMFGGALRIKFLNVDLKS